MFRTGVEPHTAEAASNQAAAEDVRQRAAKFESQAVDREPAGS